MKVYIVLVLLTLISIGCVNQETPTEEVKYSPYNVNLFSMSKLVCDPFDSNPATVQGGLKAHLYTMPNGEKPNNLDTFFNDGLKSDKNIYFSEINVPTRVFSLGFPTETGEMIQADDGTDLVEWFALSMESELKLGPEDEEGDYELALLADDGARMSIKNENNNYIVVVDNDGLHPTKMGCGQVVTMSKDTRLSVKIDYFQGPRWHISVIPMWRKVNASTLAESRCGQKGNSLFFDYNNNSQPQPAYLELLSRGWKPLTTDNWEINNSSQGEFNPCTEGSGVTISDFTVTKDSESFITATWTTDKPATSQVLFKNSMTEQEFDTGSDNILRTIHTITIDFSGISTPFEFRGVSVAEDLSKAISEPFTL